MAPVKLDLSGEGEIARRPDRAVVQITVRHKGLDQKQVAETVQRTAQEVQDRIEPLAGGAANGVATVDTAVLRWSSQPPLTTKQEVLVDDEFDNQEVIYTTVQVVRLPAVRRTRDRSRSRSGGRRKYRVMHSVTITLKVWFVDLEKLDGFRTEVAQIPHVDVTDVEWIMSDEMNSELRAEAMKIAYKDALAKATAYAQALGRPKIDPVQIREDRDADDGIVYGRDRRRPSREEYSDEYGRLERSRLPQDYEPRDITYRAKCNVIFEVE